MESYESPLSTRYASPHMSHLFSPKHRAVSWRKVWIALARAQRELGLPISSSQISELEAHRDEIHFDVIARFEKELRHDVMAHIHAYGELCPNARSILHLGATSCTITDNADLLIFREALHLIEKKLLRVIRNLATFAKENRDLPTLSFTHFQPAQLTTVGKRACLWIHELTMDLADLRHRTQNLQLLGIKGTTGTQASLLELFHGDHKKVAELEKKVTQELGFTETTPVSGQTYSRKQDDRIYQLLSGVATSAHKMATDLRLLAHLKEIEEPFGASQVGSSAMPYKRNPMKSERICALSRFLLSLAANGPHTAANQWFERTLDDSANRRLALPESFLAADGILNLLIEISDGLVVYPQVIARHVAEELPFMATENILMRAVEAGGDRQDLHERLRQHSMASSKQIKEEGLPNDLLSRIEADPHFSVDLDTIIHQENYVGLAPSQVDAFLELEVSSILEEAADSPLPSFLTTV